MYHVVIAKYKDVVEMNNDNLVNVREKERKYLLDVIRYLQYLARQEITLQGHENNDPFPQLMMLLGTKGENIIAHLDGTIRNKFTHHDIHKESMNIMSRHVLLFKLEAICKKFLFSMMADEYTDIYVIDGNLEVKEDFRGSYELENINSLTVVNAIKDNLLRFNLSLQHFRGQTYDRVAIILLVEQPKILITHCQGTLSAWVLKILLHFVKYYVCIMFTLL